MAAALKILTNFSPKISLILDQKNSHTYSDASGDTVPKTIRECRVRT